MIHERPPIFKKMFTWRILIIFVFLFGNTVLYKPNSWIHKIFLITENKPCFLHGTRQGKPASHGNNKKTSGEHLGFIMFFTFLICERRNGFSSWCRGPGSGKNHAAAKQNRKLKYSRPFIVWGPACTFKNLNIVVLS